MRLLRGEPVRLSSLGPGTGPPPAAIDRALVAMQANGTIYCKGDVVVAAYPLSGGADPAPPDLRQDDGVRVLRARCAGRPVSG